MKIGYFDCCSGAAGDMIVAACLDAGAPRDVLLEELAKLNLPKINLRIEKVKKNALAATTFVPEAPHEHHHRNLGIIREIIEAANYSPRVTVQAVTIFTALAEAEAKVHNTTIEQVHFHEVGAVDSIIDIVAACLALELLQVDKIYASPPVVGNGTVKCAHGIMPVPAPAAAELLRGIPITPTETQGELLTPTAAAILTTLAENFGPLPEMTIENIGYGAGQKNFPELPNVLRLIIGTARDLTDTTPTEVAVLEANIDDTAPEIIGFLTEQLRHAGALDVFCTPIFMKKNRPATLLSLICRPDETPKFENIIFRQSTTFGIRHHRCRRNILNRQTHTVTTTYGPVRVKQGFYQGHLITVSPEYEDCRHLALQNNLPLKDLIAAAQKAAEELT